MPERSQLARALAALFLTAAASAIGVLALLPPPRGTNVAGVLAPAICALAIGAFLWGFSGRFPAAWMGVTLALGTVLITVDLYYASDIRTGGQLFYLWVALFAFYALRLPAALAQVAWIGVAYGTMLALRHEPTAGPRWTITIATLLVAGILVARIVSRLRNLVTQSVGRERELRQADAQFRSAFDDAAIGMAVVALDGTWVRVNQALARLTGYPAERLVGMSFRDLTPAGDVGSDEAALERLVCGGHNTHTAEKRYIRADGSTVWVSLSVSVVRDGDGRPIHLISQMQDITARRAAERELAERALHDPLTGLPNRLLFTDRVQVALARTDRTGATVAVFFIDLDRFKLVNDSLGHAAGDRLLVEVAERLRGELRPSDTIARFGGDEFTVLCEQCTEPRATLVAERILASLARPFMIDGHELFANASIGIAFGHGSDAAAPVLLRNADAAMYRAKECGRSQFAVYDGGMHRLATVRLELENDLRHAIERGELRLEYQPDVSLGNRRIVGVEALLRWQHPRHGLLEPRQFVSIAEESGMIVPIGEWVIREACRQARELEDAGHPLVVAVNLSPRQLADPRLPAVLDAAIDETGVDPRLLCLEITESAAVEAQGLALASLRELGVRLALDDFGAGFSSLSQIRALPRVDTLKVDRVFTESLGERPEDDAIVAAIVGMADALEMDTVAEGIETEMQARAVAALGCRRGQGYHFARPLSSAALRRLVESAALRSEAGEAEAAEATGDPAELGAR